MRSQVPGTHTLAADYLQQRHASVSVKSCRRVCQQMVLMMISHSSDQDVHVPEMGLKLKSKADRAEVDELAHSAGSTPESCQQVWMSVPRGLGEHLSAWNAELPGCMRD